MRSAIDGYCLQTVLFTQPSKLFTLSSPTLKFIEREVGEKDKFLKMVLFRQVIYTTYLKINQVLKNLCKIKTKKVLHIRLDFFIAIILLHAILLNVPVGTKHYDKNK